MKIYISGICGTAMGALGLFLKQMGHSVCGSDRSEGAVLPELEKAGIEVKIGEQDGEFLREKNSEGKIDWLVYTSALAKEHPELAMARELGLKSSKRGEIIETARKEHGLEMVAVAGTHGKTTTTAMIIYACRELGVAVSYLVGSTLPFGGAGEYVAGSKWMIYEADEYDRNFLEFRPEIAVVTTVDYDHPDIYPTRESYAEAFAQFREQSGEVIEGVGIDERIKIAGKARKIDATLAKEAVGRIVQREGLTISEERVAEVLEKFPGAGRRFERIAEGAYSDYAHHPEEIRATIGIAKEEAERLGKKGVVVVYEPHQNARQVKIREGYRDCFAGAEKVFWLPTYLVREPEGVRVLTAEELASEVEGEGLATPAEVGEELAEELRRLVSEGYLVVMMTAGPADGWFRKAMQG